MQKLFSEFKATTAAEWKNQLLKDLKGEAYESLVWHNENGFNIKPFYTSEDLAQKYEPAFTHTHWEICVCGKTKDARELNTQLLRQLNAGATSISVDCVKLDLSTAFENIQLNYIQATFYVDAAAANELKAYLKKNYKLTEIQCSLFPEKFITEEDARSWQTVIALFHPYRNIRTVAVNALPAHNQDCLAYYEIAVALSELTEHLEAFSDKKQIPASDFVMKLGVNSDYFIQIAKLRAIRRLWSVMRSAYGIKNELYLVVQTSLTNKSISDNYNNLLRTTVEAMAAVAGGCNELIINDFDILFHSNEKLAERMTINQQLILREESYFDKMADVACGSYYIENITDALAAKALATLKRFEKQGGYFKNIHHNIPSEIAEQAKARAERIETQQQIVIGVNKFRNEKENIQLSAASIKELRELHMNNPVLNYELEHYFDLKHA